MRKLWSLIQSILALLFGLYWIWSVLSNPRIAYVGFLAPGVLVALFGVYFLWNDFIAPHLDGRAGEE